MEYELCDLTAYDLRYMLSKKEISAEDLLDSVIARIEEVEGRSGLFDYIPNAAQEAEDQSKVHAYIAPILVEKAHEQAKIVDKYLAQNEDLGPLAGIPLAIKDIFCVRDSLTTAASYILHDYKGCYDATAAARLREQATVIIGKTNLDEFVLGSSTESSAYKPVTRNPWDLSRVPGGSSGGSAAAVAAGEAIIALGSDTAGSVRQPAAFCGVVGLKPTYGRVSRWGLIAMASSLDCVGPITKSVRDCALVLQAIAGRDEYDWTAADKAVPDYLSLLNDDVVAGVCNGLRIGWPTEYFEDPDLIDPQDGKQILDALNQVKQVYIDLGAEIIEISLPHTIYAIPVYFVISRVELATNLHRYDGVKYGHRSARITHKLFEMYEYTRTEGFGEQPKQRIFMGMHASSARNFNEFYDRAGKLQILIRQDFEKAFEKVDVIMSSTTPTTAFPLGGIYGDTVQMQNADRLTVPANLAEIPAISLPCGFDGDGLPIGLQLIGPAFREDLILQVAYSYERETDWHKNRPMEHLRREIRTRDI